MPSQARQDDCSPSVIASSLSGTGLEQPELIRMTSSRWTRSTSRDSYSTAPRAMSDLVRQLQSLILTAATTVDLWRDAAIAVLAIIAIGCLAFAGEVLLPDEPR